MKAPRDISGPKAVKALERLGFLRTRQSGSHTRLVKGSCNVTVPMHRTLDVGTLQSILRQADVTLDEFMNEL